MLKDPKVKYIIFLLYNVTRPQNKIYIYPSVNKIVSKVHNYPAVKCNNTFKKWTNLPGCTIQCNTRKGMYV